jgi:hypothetical protein
MAKKRAKAQAVIPAALQALSAKVRKAIEAVQRPFRAFTEDLRLVNESRAELAPRFYQAFQMAKEEAGLTFVEFVRILDPDVPMNSRATAENAGYVNHPSYNAALYLRRLAEQQVRAETTPQQQAERAANAAVTPSTAVARLIKAIMPLLQPQLTEQIWEAMRAQLHWPDRTVQRIKNETQSVEPLVVLKEPRGLHAVGQFRLAVPQQQEELAATGT